MFLAHLWKEFRDHRGLFGAQLLIVVLGCGLLAWFTPYDEWERFLLPQMLAFACVASLMLGGDVFAGEARRGKQHLLARLPGALRMSFLAKLSVLLLAVGLTTGLGVLTGSLVRTLFPGDATELWFGGVWLMSPAWMGAAFAVLAAWTLATSCWIRHGSLAFPGACVLLALLAVPFYLTHRGLPGLWPTLGELWTVSLIVAAAGLTAAYLSFTRGHRSATCAATAARVLPIALLLCLPAYGLGYQRVRDYTSIDPGDERFRITGARVGETGRFAFVNAQNGGLFSGTPSHALVVDLEDGSWSEPLFSMWNMGRGGSFHGAPLPLGTVRFQPSGTQHIDLARLLDGRTGRVVPAPTTPEDRERQAALLLEMQLAKEYATRSLADVFTIGRDTYGLKTLDGSWSHLPWDQACFRPFFGLRDGQVLVESHPDADGRMELGLVEPASGTHRSLRFEDGSSALVRSAFTGFRLQTPGGRLVVALRLDEDRWTFARLDPGQDRLVRILVDDLGPIGLAACMDEDTVIAIANGGCALERFRFGSAEREVLFPR